MSYVLKLPILHLPYLALYYLNVFLNKGMKFIGLHSIFKNKAVISSAPNYFNNTETLIICVLIYIRIKREIGAVKHA